MTKQQQQAERAKALEYLREYLKPGDTVYTVLRHVSRSGLSRSISPIVILAGGKPYDVAHLAARVFGLPFDRDNGGVKTTSDGHSLVYELSYALWRESALSHTQL